MSTINNMSFDEFGSMITGTVSTTAASKTVLDTSGAVPTSPYGDENRLFGPTNVPICARGLGASSNTGINKANKNVAHVCNFSDETLQMFYKAGAMGGQIVMAIRNGIKALLKALGFQPSANGFAAELKKLAQSIKNALKWLNDINDFLQGFVKYAELIGKLINYLLTLPKAIFAYFKDCYDQAIEALKKGYIDAVAALSGTDNTAKETSDIKDSINSIKSDIDAAQTTVASIAATPSKVIDGLTNASGTVTPAQFTAAAAALYPDNQKDPNQYQKA